MQRYHHGSVFSKVKTHSSPVKTHCRAFLLADDVRFTYLCPAMRLLCRIAYWLVALVLLALILVSLDYTAPQAVLISLAFCPCALALEFLIPKARKTMDKVYLSLAMLVTVFLLILILHNLVWIRITPEGFHTNPKKVAPMLINPAFLALILMVLALGDFFWARWIGKRFKDEDRSVTFFSDRKSVTLRRSEIAYIESNDTEVRIVATSGEAHRNKTGIGQWENLLGDGFLRIHRSYLVNAALATLATPDSVMVGETQLPVSRKYKEAVQNALTPPQP